MWQRNDCLSFNLLHFLWSFYILKRFNLLSFSRFDSYLKLQNRYNFCQQQYLYGLWKHLIHPTSQCSINIRLFCMPCNRNDYWLAQILIINILSYLLCGFIPVHHRHVAVHNDKIIFAEHTLVLGNIVDYCFKGLFAVESLVTDFLDVYHSDSIFKNNLNGINVKTLVVNDQDPFWSFLRSLDIGVTYFIFLLLDDLADLIYFFWFPLEFKLGLIVKLDYRICLSWIYNWPSLW